MTVGGIGSILNPIDDEMMMRLYLYIRQYTLLSLWGDYGALLHWPPPTLNMQCMGPPPTLNMQASGCMGLSMQASKYPHPPSTCNKPLSAWAPTHPQQASQ